MTTKEIIARAVPAKREIGLADTETKNRLLLSMADELIAGESEIFAANAEDVREAKDHVSPVMIDRLLLNEKRIAEMAEGLRSVAKLPDPVGELLQERKADNGLLIRRVSVPMGVIAVIYESRPNVTSDAAALCVKSGSACILRGGKEAFRTSCAIVKALKRGLRKLNFSENIVSMVEDTSRESARELMTARGQIDLLIPRGGAGLIRACVEQATVPVIETGTGICTVYVDRAADQEKALRIIENAKTQRPSVCNAAEQLLVHEKIAADFLPKVKKLLSDERAAQGKIPVELRLSENARKYTDGTAASAQDFDMEFLDYILAVDTVRDVCEAVEHIEAHSTHHSEAIVTEDREAADYFTSRIDSAAVYVNASTRFTDGGCFGLGCEMGISTQKLHARGPMGLSELCSCKYIIEGNGQIR